MEVARGPSYDRRYGGVITIIDESTGLTKSHSNKGKESIILTYGCMRHQDIMLLNEEGPAGYQFAMKGYSLVGAAAALLTVRHE